MIERIRADLAAYEKAHRNPWNQRLHYIAFACAFFGWVFLLIDWRATVLLAVAHYTLSWIGHFFFEKNKPASFKRPLLGFYAGFLWFFFTTFRAGRN
ncbi:DUF962 domain-containing protein [Tumebacillus flagellatus]|uniref:Membrane protein n=1 Tax=Tumebacillus flagellatus TaxID=1157490 RepID=A0A074MET5_9BACL|nr:DUF962 domain-containing protein [Tumebacillus flagellatus]KEO84302.1 membrane protein [Tumebacillus flagellatus]